LCITFQTQTPHSHRLAGTDIETNRLTEIEFHDRKMQRRGKIFDANLLQTVHTDVGDE